MRICRAHKCIMSTWAARLCGAWNQPVVSHSCQGRDFAKLSFICLYYDWIINEESTVMKASMFINKEIEWGNSNLHFLLLLELPSVSILHFQISSCGTVFGWYPANEWIIIIFF